MAKATRRATAYIDGGSRGNPGPAAAGVVILDDDGRTVLHEQGLFIGHATNNVAEYRGLLAALVAARAIGVTELHVRSDSELMVRQMNGQYRVKNENLRPLFQEAKQLADAFDACELTHVRRESNRQADALVNRALDEKRSFTFDGE